MKPKGTSRLFTGSTALIVASFVTSSAFAASATWNGTTSTTWADASNWDGPPATAPSTGETATFNNAGNGKTTLDLGAGVSIGSIVFDTSAAAAYTLGTGAVGSQSLTLASAGSVSLSNTVTTNQVVNANVSLSNVAAAATTFTNNSSGSLGFAGTIAANVVSGNGVLTVSGTGNTVVAGAITKPGAGSNALLKTGSGTLTLGNGSVWNGAGAIGRVPSSAGFPLVAREGVLLLNGGTHTVTGELVVGGVVADAGPGQNAKIQVDAGTLAVSSWLSLGRGNGVGAVSSDIVLNNAGAITTGDFSAGFDGGAATNAAKGTFTLNNTSSFTVNANGAFNFGESLGSNMTMTVNNSAQVIAAGTGIKRIGNLGTGVLNINDNATVNFGNQIVYLGYRTGNGTVNISGGTFTTAGEVRVGGSDTTGVDTAIGSLNVSGGTANLASLVVARANSATGLISGSATISGGTVNVVNDVVLGFAGANNLGKLTISGGTFNVGTAGTKWLCVGQWDTSKGEIDITSGALKLLNGTQIKMNRDGTTGPNIINQSGGTVTFYSDSGTTVGGGGHVDLQRVGAAASNNTYNLDGGILTVPQIVSTAATGTRTFNFNGGTLKAAVSQAAFFSLGGGNAFANVRNGGAIIDTNGFDVSVASPLIHSNVSGDNLTDGGLTKLSGGNLVLNGLNTYTGATLVTGGTLTLGTNGDVNTSTSITVNGSGAKLVQANSNTISTPVTLANGSLDGSGTIDTLTVANAVGNTLTSGNGVVGIAPLTVGTMTFQGAATLNIQADGQGSEHYISTTTLVTNAAGKVVVNATNRSGIWTSGSDYTVLDFTSFTGLLSHFTLGTVPGLNSNQTATLVNTGSSIVVRITGESLIWTGAQNANWTTVAVGGSKNWKYLGAGIEFTTNSPVIFDDSASNFNVNIAQNVSPSAIVFEHNDPKSYTISSTGGFGITSGTLVLNGDGKVTLTVPDTSTSATNINNELGILEITGAGSIAASSSITNKGSLILNLAGAPQVYPNPINGTGSVTKLGNATLTLSGANTFSGNFTLDGGVLNFNSANALGTGTGIITLNVGTLDNTSGGALTSTSTKPQVWNTDITFTGTNSLAMGTGTVTLGGEGASRTVNVVANTFGAGAISGPAFDLHKTGAGTLQLDPAVASTIGGMLDVQAGVFNIGKNDFNSSGISGTGVIGNGSTIERWLYVTNTVDQTFSGTLQNSGTGPLGFLKQGPASMTLSGANTFTGSFTVAAGTLNLTGGLAANAVAANFRVGNVAETPARLNIEPTATIGNRLSLYVGLAGPGAVYQNGSALTLTGAGTDGFRLGSNVGGYGYYKLSGGAFTVGEAGIGGLANDTAGVMDITGGTFSTAGYITVGRGGLTSSGLLNVTGGSVSAARMELNWAGAAGAQSVVNIGGGAGAAGITLAPSATLGLQLSSNAIAGTVGIVNLLPNGTLTTGIVGDANANPTGLLNFNGGVLKAATTNAGATFLSSANGGVYVYGNGGTVDNSGTAITIAKPLIGATGYGVSSISVTGGTGYVGAPLVKISGGIGTGATGHATIDGSGNLTGIVIDSPGSGYDTGDTLSVALVGGGGSGAVVGSVSLAEHTAHGGINFTGAAITTLSGVSTYTGNTTVSSGSIVYLGDNAGLKFAPAANGVSNKVTGAGAAYLYGDFTIDLGGAAIANGNSWTLVDTAAKSFDPLTFTVVGFTEVTPGIHQLVDANKTWTFTESTGALTLAVSTGSGYSTWAAGFGLAAGDQDPTDDPDHDGFSNLTEYVLGGNPSQSDTSIAPTGQKVGSNYIFTFKRSDASEADTTQFVEYGDNLTVWGSYAIGASPGTAPVSIGENTPTADVDTVTVTIPTAGATKFFARLKVLK